MPFNFSVSEMFKRKYICIETCRLNHQLAYASSTRIVQFENICYSGREVEIVIEIRTAFIEKISSPQPLLKKLKITTELNIEIILEQVEHQIKIKKSVTGSAKLEL